MNRKQRNRTGMANTVSAYMKLNSTIWSGNVAISGTVSDLNTAIGQVDQKAGQQQTPITGAAAQKVQLRHDYEDEIFLIASQICSLAGKNNDLVTVAATELTEAMLEKMDDDDLEETGTRIAGLATTNLAALAAYNITAADVTNLGNLTLQFHDQKTAPRTAVAGRASQTKTLPPAIKSISSILRNHLDKEMVTYKKSNPEFYAGYLAARVIVDRGGHNDGSSTPPAAPKPPQT